MARKTKAIVAALNARWGKGKWGKGKKKSSKKSGKKRGPGRPRKVGRPKGTKCIISMKDLQDIAAGRATLRRG